MSTKQVAFYPDNGIVNRSSAIFYYRCAPNFNTTLSFMNYWEVKRGLSVTIIATTRTMSGAIIQKEQLDFSRGQVINYAPNLGEFEFEGSVEVEVFSNENLFIPYAAIMAIYESRKSLSLTHSYARAYSPADIAGGNVFSSGNEGCWTIRDDRYTRSFCVFHNGPKALSAQDVELRVVNCNGISKTGYISLDRLDPYQTVKIFPKDHIDDLANFLGDNEGSATIDFELGESFSRMLIGNERNNYDEIQTAHSNFNYAIKEQDSIENEAEPATMLLPDFELGEQKVIIYPDYAPGDYRAQVGDQTAWFSSSDRRPRFFECSDNQLEIWRIDGSIPTRLVTGFIAQYNENLLPVEVSRGIRHSLEPPKSSWWGPCIVSDELNSKLVLNPYEKYCDLSPRSPATLSLYSSVSHDVLSLDFEDLPVDLTRKGVFLQELTQVDLRAFFGGEVGYFYLKSTFTSFDCLTVFQRNDGAIGIEHCF